MCKYTHLCKLFPSYNYLMIMDWDFFFNVYFSPLTKVISPGDGPTIYCSHAPIVEFIWKILQLKKTSQPSNKASLWTCRLETKKHTTNIFGLAQRSLVMCMTEYICL